MRTRQMHLGINQYSPGKQSENIEQSVHQSEGTAR